MGVKKIEQMEGQNIELIEHSPCLIDDFNLPHDLCNVRSCDSLFSDLSGKQIEWSVALGDQHALARQALCTEVREVWI